MAKSTDRTGEQKTPSVPSLAPTAVELDDLDRALFERLRIDGRESNRSLGSKLNVNEVTVAARLRRLEESGVMRVVAITDIRLFGHREFAFAMINVGGRSVYEVAADLAKQSRLRCPPAGSTSSSPSWDGIVCTSQNCLAQCSPRSRVSAPYTPAWRWTC